MLDSHVEILEVVDVPMLRTTHSRVIRRVATEPFEKPSTNSRRYEMECVIPIPPAISTLDPYESNEWIAPLLLISSDIDMQIEFHIPKGPSAKAKTRR